MRDHFLCNILLYIICYSILVVYQTIQMKWYFILFFFVMFLLIIVSYFVFRDKVTDSFRSNSSSPSVQFLTKKQFTQILLENKDKYYETFNKNDLKVRNIKDIQDYLPIINKSTCEGTSKLKSRIQSAIRKIEQKMRQMESNSILHGIVIRKWRQLPWKIGFTCDSQYEFGFPHTRNDIIVLNVADALSRSDHKLCKLLIHEKTHVYQKRYKHDMEKYFQSKGLRIVDTKTKEKQYIPANPDINSHVYDDLETKFQYYAKYRKNPTTHHDIRFAKNHPKFEHPLEKIAYDMEDVMETKYQYNIKK